MFYNQIAVFNARQRCWTNYVKFTLKVVAHFTNPPTAPLRPKRKAEISSARANRSSLSASFGRCHGVKERSSYLVQLIKIGPLNCRKNYISFIFYNHVSPVTICAGERQRYHMRVDAFPAGWPVCHNLNSNSDKLSRWVYLCPYGNVFSSFITE